MGLNDTIPALTRAVELIESVADGMQAHSIAEISRKLGIPQTTCYRIVRTLIEADWLQPCSRGVGYELSYGLMPLLRPFENHRVLINTIHPIVAELVASCGVSAKLSASDGRDAVTIHRWVSDRPIALSGRLGMHFSLALGSSGSALLNGLPDERIEAILKSAPDSVWDHQAPDDVWSRIAHCRQHRWCVDNGHYSLQIHSLSAPLHGGQGEVWAVVTLLGMPGDFDEPHRGELAKQLMACVQQCHQATNAVMEGPHEDR